MNHTYSFSPAIELADGKVWRIARCIPDDGSAPRYYVENIFPGEYEEWCTFYNWGAFRLESLAMAAILLASEADELDQPAIALRALVEANGGHCDY